MSTHKLWYTHPAAEYIDGLPIGTGRLVAMVLGQPETERVALNHEWRPRPDRLSLRKQMQGPSSSACASRLNLERCT